MLTIASMLAASRLQVVVLGHVLAADINIGYEEIINTQVCGWAGGWGVGGTTARLVCC